MTATDVIPGDGSVPRVAVRGIALAVLVHNLPVLVWARPILAVELALKSIIRRIVEILVLIREREKNKRTRCGASGRYGCHWHIRICERYRCESMDSCE